jgi:hypothetical protein
MANAKLGLAETVEALRDELSQAISEAEGERLRFALGDVELELSVTVSRGGSAGARVRFWVVDADASGSLGRQSVQTLRLKLTPHDTLARRPGDPDPATFTTAYVEGAGVPGEDLPGTGRASG